jgi:outer membrane murein-binding lipoprotein Lpp
VGAVVIGTVTAGGCSSKEPCPKLPKLVKYQAPPPVELTIDQSTADAKLRTLEVAIKALVAKTRQQAELLKAYEEQVDIINSIGERSK